MNQQDFLNLWMQAKSIITGVNEVVIVLKVGYDPNNDVQFFKDMEQSIAIVQEELNFLYRNRSVLSDNTLYTGIVRAAQGVKELHLKTRNIIFKMGPVDHHVTVTSNYAAYIPPS